MRVGSGGTLWTLCLAALVGALVTVGLGPLEDPEAAIQQRRFTNPLYDRFQEIAEREGIDVSFTRRVTRDPGQRDVRNHPLFRSAPGSWDVIILGDSTVAWGLIPQVISERSGLRVASFGFAGNVLNRKGTWLYRRIIERYLAPAGRVVLMFTSWTQVLSPEAQPHNGFEDLDQAGFDELTQRGRRRRWSYRDYRELRDELERGLASRLGLRLPSVGVYGSWVEPLANPAWSARKRESREKDVRIRFGWDQWTVTLSNPNIRRWSRFSNRPAVTIEVAAPEKQRRFAEINAEAACQLPGRKIYAIPWSETDKEYAAARAIYREYYSHAMELLDLGRLHERGERYPLEQYHFANESGLIASLLIGDWLRENP
jgi:hypothetical protein